MSSKKRVVNFFWLFLSIFLLASVVTFFYSDEILFGKPSIVVLKCSTTNMKNTSYNSNLHIGPKVSTDDSMVLRRVTPKPRIEKYTGRYLIISYDNFVVNHDYKNDILDQAVNRMIDRAFPDKYIRSENSGQEVISLRIIVKDTNTKLSLERNERYSLEIAPGESILSSETIWGALHGLETFRQLVYHCKMKNKNFIPEVHIEDFPEFSYRGFLIDTSRHFLRPYYIKKQIEAMATVKLNVLHWHIVDDQSFPYVSRKFPDMHTKGASNPRTHVFTPNDVVDLVEYARYRGIMVIPEFDTPGHVNSWVGSKGVLVSCPNQGDYKLVDPSLNSTYEFMRELFIEVRDLFKTDIIHIGGDEVDGRCWFDNERIVSYAKSVGVYKPSELQAHYTQRLINTISHTFSSFIAWDEVFFNSYIYDPRIIFHLWRDAYLKDLDSILKKGIRVIVSAGFYIDLSTADWDWKEVYKMNLKKNLNPHDSKYLLGGEICQWGEHISESNMLEDSWVRSTVIAERLWSEYTEAMDFNETLHRIDLHHCRLKEMGIKSRPLRDSYRCL